MFDLLKPAVLRGLAYLLTIALSALFAWLSSIGYGTYDPATGLFDPHPVSVYVIVPAIVAGIGGPALALVALVKGWGAR